MSLTTEALTRAQPSAQPESVTDTSASMMEQGAAGTERRQVTVLFSDLVNSTELARMLGDTYHEVLRAYFAESEKVVRRFDGRVKQRLGDGLLVFFGDPNAHETTRSAQSAPDSASWRPSAVSMTPHSASITCISPSGSESARGSWSQGWLAKAPTPSVWWSAKRPIWRHGSRMPPNPAPSSSAIPRGD